jgi:hypothetical protein
MTRSSMFSVREAFLGAGSVEDRYRRSLAALRLTDITTTSVGISLIEGRAD